MKTFRKLLVKHFVLDYFINLFGKTYNAPRASRIIFPLFVITGFFVATNPNWPTPSLFIWFLYLLCLISLFFGFIYFRIYPVKWEELDDLQKFQYGSFQHSKLTKEQKREWQIIYNRINKYL